MELGIPEIPSDKTVVFLRAPSVGSKFIYNAQSSHEKLAEAFQTWYPNSYLESVSTEQDVRIALQKALHSPLSQSRAPERRRLDLILCWLGHASMDAESDSLLLNLHPKMGDKPAETMRVERLLELLSEALPQHQGKADEATLGKLTIILDCCYSGWGADGLISHHHHHPFAKSFHAIGSTKSWQESPIGNTVTPFTGHMLTALNKLSGHSAEGLQEALVALLSKRDKISERQHVSVRDKFNPDYRRSKELLIGTAKTLNGVLNGKFGELGASRSSESQVDRARWSTFPTLNFVSVLAPPNPGFIGRVAAMEEFDKWLRRGNRTYFLESPEGTGKTAWLAHLVRLSQNGALPKFLACHFASHNVEEWRRLKEFYHNMVSQVLDNVTLDSKRKWTPNPDIHMTPLEVAVELKNLMQNLAPPFHGTYFIFVDGLDASPTIASAIASLLGMKLPSFVRFVVSSRLPDLPQSVRYNFPKSDSKDLKTWLDAKYPDNRYTSHAAHRAGENFNRADAWIRSHDVITESLKQGELRDGDSSPQLKVRASRMTQGSAAVLAPFMALLHASHRVGPVLLDVLYEAAEVMDISPGDLDVYIGELQNYLSVSGGYLSARAETIHELKTTDAGVDKAHYAISRGGLRMWKSLSIQDQVRVLSHLVFCRPSDFSKLMRRRRNRFVLSVVVDDETLVSLACNYHRMDLLNGVLYQTSSAMMLQGSMTPLHVAVADGNVNTINELLEKHPKLLNAANSGGFTPLHVACAQNQLVSVSALLEYRKVRVNATTTEKGLTALHFAVQTGNLELVSRLLDVPRLRVARFSHDGRTPLHVACEFGSLDVVKLVSARSPTLLNASDVTGSTPLHLAAARMNGAPILVHLLNSMDKQSSWKQQAVLSPRHDGRLPLHVAAIAGNAKVVRTLMRHGTHQASQKDAIGLTPLHHACREGKSGAARVLVQFKANTEVTTPYDWTALHFAAAHGYKAITTMLLRAKPSLATLVTSKSETPFALAEGRGHHEVAELLSSRLVSPVLSPKSSSSKSRSSRRSSHSSVSSQKSSKSGKSGKSGKSRKSGSRHSAPPTHQ